jgi:RNA polymerase sigma factor (sigma-70 family)
MTRIIRPPGPGGGEATGPADHSADSTIVLLERAQQGDQDAVEALVVRAAPSVRRWARGRLPPYVRQDANTEDVVQDAVVQTLRRLKRVRHRTVGGMQAYLRTSVMNRIRDLIRGTRRHGVPLELDDRIKDDAPSPLEIAIRQQGLTRFLEALQRLKPTDREVIIWRIELGYSVAEIAAQLGKSGPAAGMSVSRAIARLAAELKIAGDDSPAETSSGKQS